MAKPTKQKKVDVEEVADISVEKPKKEKKAEYHLVVKLNDQVFEIDTVDLAEAIKSFEPEFLRTRVIIQVTNSAGKTLERVLYLNDGKRLFNNRYTLEALIRNLIF